MSFSVHFVKSLGPSFWRPPEQDQPRDDFDHFFHLGSCEIHDEKTSSWFPRILIYSILRGKKYVKLHIQGFPNKRGIKIDQLVNPAPFQADLKTVAVLQWQVANFSHLDLSKRIYSLSKIQRLFHFSIGWSETQTNFITNSSKTSVTSCSGLQQIVHDLRQSVLT